MRLVVVTGMSGGGKRTAMKMLEDVGYYCVDNLPVQLIDKFVDLITDKDTEYSKVALGIDVRADMPFQQVCETLKELKKTPIRLDILFLECSDAVLLKRYKETRRIHPLAADGRIDEAEAEAMLIMNTRGGYAVVCLLAPVAEELVFRGAALRTLLAWKPQYRWLMIVLSALLFAMAHLNPAQLLHPFLIGLLLGWMYERTGSVVPGIIYHWANNTAAYLLYHVYPDTDITLAEMFGSEGRALMGLLFSLLIIIPAIYQLHMNMKTTTDYTD